MSLFLSPAEKENFECLRRSSPVAQTLFWMLINRAEKRASSPGLTGPATVDYWWHHASDYLTDAAMANALKPSPSLALWIRDVTLSIVRRPRADWIGPAFRDHAGPEPAGNLETAHLTWAVAIALDLAADAFTPVEQEEIAGALRAKGLVLCRRWLDRNNHLANWRCVLNAGVGVAAAVLDDKEQLRHSGEEFRLCQQVFQPDGSYGESLQYGNYAASTQMLTWEALVRRSPELADSLCLEPYCLMPRWQATSLLYNKPLSGWGGHPKPRSANFNDSAALFRPSADLLLHISARSKDKHPLEAGLARWLFDTLYLPGISAKGGGSASFGFDNDFGFLTFALLPQAVAALSPEEAGLPPTSGFSCGDLFARDSWTGRTILAVHGAGDALHGSGHLHGDLNSFILVHNRERLLVDPGHCCYRNLLHELDKSSQTHNTCTFLAGDRTIQQTTRLRRCFNPADRTPEAAVDRRGRRLLLERIDDVTAMGSEVAALYGKPITEFSRFWFLCGTHALFIVDRILFSEPVKTTWNWLLNNRDGDLDLKIIPPDRLVARRGDAGIKLFHLGNGNMRGPIHAHIHDTYQTAPAQKGEGAPGSGQLVRWTEKSPLVERTVVHAICVDHYGSVAGWHFRVEEGFAAILEGPQRSEIWKLKIDTAALEFHIDETITGRRYSITNQPASGWTLNKL